MQPWKGRPNQPTYMEINMAKKPTKQSSDRLSSLASKALRGETLTKEEVKSLAGSVLAQDETKGKRQPEKS